MKSIPELEKQKPGLGRDTMLVNLHLKEAWNLQGSESDSSIYHCQKALQVIHRHLGTKTKDFLPLVSKQLDKKPQETFAMAYAMARTQSVMGVIYDVKGNFPRSLEHYFFALKIFRLLEKQPLRQADVLNNKASVYGNIAIVYEELGEFDKALDYNRRSLALNRQLGHKHGEAIALGNIAILHHSAKRYEEAKRDFETAITLLRSMDDEAGLSMNISNLGVTYLEQKQYAKALELFKESLEIDRRLGRTQGIASKLGNMGLVYLRTGEQEKAEKKLLEALALSEELGSPALLKDHHFFLYELYRDTKQFQSAMDHYRQYEAYGDSLKNYEVVKKQTLLEANYAFDKIREAQRMKQDKKDAIAALEKKNRETVLLLVLIVLVLVVLLALIIFRNLQKRRKQVELDNARRQLEIEVKLLRTQMNPHFIFNCLNSVHTYINSENTQKAGDLLLKFSRLIRLILQHSTKELVNLPEEIEQIRLYTAIEQSRFSDSFSCSIHVDPSLEADEIKIPTMVIQPFVENAVLHGVGPLKDRRGELKIRFLPGEKDMLRVIIEDNGAGRRDKGEKTPGHESLSVKLITERLRLMNPGSEKTVAITDLEQGTRVELSIPFKYAF